MVEEIDDPDRVTVARLGEVYEQRYHRLLRVAEAIIGDAELAHDAVQEAFARAIRSRSEFRGDGTVEGWVWRTLVNTARNVRRERGPELRELPGPDVLDQPAGSSGGHRDADVRALVAGLPERQRLVLFLRYYADLDYRQIGAAIEIDPGTVGATLNRAHAAVRTQFERGPR